jgi:hypothetical protein
MSTPEGATPPSAGRPPGSAPAGKPIVWIVIAAVAVLVAIGLGIWALTTKSDLDSADKTIKEQKAAIAVAGGKEQAAVVVEDREIKDYERIRRRLVREKRTAAQQRREISTQKAQAQTAQNELNAATTRDARLVAEANLLKEQLDVAQACTNGTISAIDNVFSATSATAGVKRLNSDLNALSADCKETVG